MSEGITNSWDLEPVHHARRSSGSIKGLFAYPAKIKARPYRERALTSAMIPPGAVTGIIEATEALAHNQCRWPIGDPKDPLFHYCPCAKSLEDKSYCHEHARRRRSRRQPVDDAKAHA